MSHLLRRTLLPLLIAAALLTQLSAQKAPASFHVEVSGRGAPMILIPGLSSSGEVWRSTVERYGSRYECHVLTLAGFAGQPPIANFSLTRVVDELALYIESRHLAKVTVIGHSLGGSLALKLASDHPQLVGRLIIVDSLPAFGGSWNPTASPEQLRAMAEQIRANMKALPAEKRADMAKQSIEPMVTAPADLERILGWSRASDFDTTADAMADLIALDQRESIAAIQAPTLVLGTWAAFAQYGGEAAVRKTFDAQYVKLSGAHFAMAPKARHFIMYDDPQWFFAELDGFLPAAR